MRISRIIIGCASAVAVLAGAACGDDGVAERGPAIETDTGDAEGAPEVEASAEPITLQDLETRCDELEDIAADLRGDDPEVVSTGSTPPGPTGVMVGETVGYRTASCIYGWGEDSFNTPDRITFQIDEPVEDEVSEEVRNNLWDALAFDSEPAGVGDGARFHHGVSFDAQSVLHVRVGEGVVRIRVQVPEDLADAPYLEEDRIVAAAEDLLPRLDPTGSGASTGS